MPISWIYRWRDSVICLFVGVLFNACAAPSQRAARPQPAAPSSPQTIQTHAPRPSSLSSKLLELSCADPSALKGAGIGQTPGEALAQAQKEIALQIQATIEGLNETYRSSVRVGNREESSRAWSAQVRQMTQLSNAQEARQERVLQQDGQFGVVACMAREAAARPFREQFVPLADSFAMAAATVVAQAHPLHKVKAWQDAQTLHGRLQPLIGILEGLGELGEAEKLRIQDHYRRMTEDFSVFRSRYAMFWDDLSGEPAAAVFAKLSSRYKLKTGSCEQGLLLSVESAQADCQPGAFGMTCSWVPVLQGRSCNGELYFSLRAPELRGIGKYDEEEALRRLGTAIKNGNFWNEWFAELDQWGIP